MWQIAASGRNLYATVDSTVVYCPKVRLAQAAMAQDTVTPSCPHSAANSGSIS